MKAELNLLIFSYQDSFFSLTRREQGSSGFGEVLLLADKNNSDLGSFKFRHWPFAVHLHVFGIGSFGVKFWIIEIYLSGDWVKGGGWYMLKALEM